MRLLIFFDLPVDTARQRKDYRQFRRYLLKDGYLMMQESVYAKLVVNDGVAAAAVIRLRNNRPPSGLVQVLKVSEGQFATMEYITGEVRSYDEVDSMEELLIL
ncbi:CRISPR-associated protein, Cas2 family [Coriobacterium glomerans PW2]|uniref:CRISPR-associated endoribonuclease Cas2 n=1 Tax=Coriobacterium glomerans (strain ATCC 49209 / DSM 20642 / JCM 10262 / PW2) TaxID=700015 RepID=F2N987_CORGP|nr:CRISPR-associated endonuclease Cas2 [Coriobacterium glomerans]AEB07835.1 CRISPR-associated protein, Cas2 family [Coriobacterium glomerans PW2]